MKGLKTVLLAVALLTGVNTSMALAPSESVVKAAEEWVEKNKAQLPINMANAISISHLVYDKTMNTFIYGYCYTVPVDKPSKGAIKDAKKRLIEMLKAHPEYPDVNLVLNHGVTINYNYYTKEGDFLYNIKVTSFDLH